MKILTPIATFIRSLFSTGPLVTRTFYWRSGSGIHCRLKLSTWYPRFTATFSEPLSSWLWDDWLQWRDDQIKDFEQAVNTQIDDDEKENVTVGIFQRGK